LEDSARLEAEQALRSEVAAAAQVEAVQMHRSEAAMRLEAQEARAAALQIEAHAQEPGPCKRKSAAWQQPVAVEPAPRVPPGEGRRATQRRRRQGQDQMKKGGQQPMLRGTSSGEAERPNGPH
jgi:hypothetical protein